jgi:predicted transcriptional regulator
MKPIENIRRNIFGITQSAFAAIAEVSQATVSRWESGEIEPTLDQISRIRNAAIRAGKQWRDDLLFDPPPVEIGSDFPRPFPVAGGAP